MRHITYGPIPYSLLRSILLLLLLPMCAAAQYNLSATSYSQNFDGLGTSSHTGVTDGSLGNINSNLGGWYFYETGSAANNDISAGTGSASTGDNYHFGASGSTQRALGGLRSGTLVPYFGFYFTNTTGAVITSITITYTGETWRVGSSGRSDRLDFQYSIDATGLGNGTWVDVNSLDYTNNASSTGSGSLLQSATVTATISNIGIVNGASFFIRWSDFDASGSDDAMGINDFSFTTASSGTYSSATDHFRSAVSSGNWGAPNNWQSSADGISNWITATLFPTSSAAAITVKNGHSITLASAATANQLVVEQGATLTHNSGVTFSIANNTGTDMNISGTYVLNGAQPVLASGVSVEIQSGGVVRVDANTGSGSDDFARSTQVLFKTGSIFQWNINTSFTSGNVTYFNAAGSALEKPIFRVTGAPSVGAATTLTINGKFESNASNFQFVNSGTKIFRDGLGGTGTIIHSSTSGTFKITAADAVIDGSLQLQLENSSVSPALEIASGATVTLKNTASVTVGSATAPGAELLVAGTLIHQSGTAINLGYGHFTVTGSLDPSSTGSFKGSSTAGGAVTNISIAGTATAPVFSFENGYEYINAFTINSAGGKVVLGSNLYSKNLTLTNGIIITGNNLFTFLNESGTGSGLTVAGYTQNSTAYKNSYICTCDETGTSIPVTDGSKGFRINNVGTTEIMFPVGADLVSPNRMSMKNDGAADDFTVVVAIGDIANTPMPVVYRKWYINERVAPATAADSSQVSMKLYFTKRDASLFLSGQNELETGFDFTDMHLAHKTTANYFSHVSNGSDKLSTSPGNYNFDTEMYGMYNRGVSVADGNLSNGLTRFGGAFSVVNQGGFILPVKFVSVNAVASGKYVDVAWAVAEQTNIQHYEVEFSEDGHNFRQVARIKAGRKSNYAWQHVGHGWAKAYYRIKALDNNGRFYYSGVSVANPARSGQQVSVAPNPVKGQRIQLFTQQLPTSTYQLTVNNSLGIKVYQTIIHQVQSARQQVTLPGLPPGLYYLSLYRNNNLVTTLPLVIY
ncbi:T9SS type A sorting domain-containing protein [Foetidibacter luteolus]|uniref:T9SS type A sorting domain-containing protein n=1 Tax=Foetidibacter luteolus TaxID=2608880 RepID=UPI00129B14A4|nr:T9SS type A sorting domain-containing protein [Foetidibacter luteolus]